MSEQLWQRYYGAPNARYHNRQQYGVLIDLNKCLGCHTCQVVCKTTWSDGPGQESMYWDHVNTKPFGEATKDHPNLYGDVPTGIYPQLWQFYLPQMCNHCSEPACLQACPAGAIYKRSDGFVLIDQDECIGTKSCIGACPYRNISFNAHTKTSQKCIGCYPLVEKGEEPVCVRSCPGKARIFGDLMNPDSAISKVIRSGTVEVRPDLSDSQFPRARTRTMSGGEVRPLRPDHGTIPSVWYIVPRGVPQEEIEKYFGMAMGGRREEPHVIPGNLKMKV
jgi:Fe-S-cluster-containing dehydrogenase component